MQLRQPVADMEAAPSAAAMLDLHAAQVRSVSERSAAIARTVEHGASGDRRVARLWRRMTENRRHGLDWATRTLLAKPDVDATLAVDDITSTFWIALDWSTYRSLAHELGLSPQSFERWLREYYRRMLGA